MKYAVFLADSGKQAVFGNKRRFFWGCTLAVGRLFFTEKLFRPMVYQPKAQKTLPQADKISLFCIKNTKIFDFSVKR